MSATVSMLINVLAILLGLFIYLLIMNSKWGKEHMKYQYPIMLGAIMAAVFIGIAIRYCILMF